MSSLATPAPSELPRPGAFAGQRVRWTAGLVGLAAILFAIAVTPADLPAGTTIVRFSGVVLPVGVGLVGLARRADDRFALLLVGAGVLWSLTPLAESSAAVPYSIGREAVWLVEPAIILLLLTFPSGRIRAERDRRLWKVILATALVLYLPTGLLAPFPLPSPWTSCGSAASCPDNAFQFVHAGAFVSDVVRPLREAATSVLFALVALSVVRRAVAARRFLRPVLAPVAAVAALRVVTLSIYFVVRRSGEGSAAADVLGWLYVLSLPIVTVAFAAGLVGAQVYAVDALARLTGSLAAGPGARRLRASLAVALRDPRVEVAFSETAKDRWVDADGAELPDFRAGLPSGRTVTEVRDGGRRVAAFTHDAELVEHPQLIDGIRAYVVAALANDRLVTRLRRSVRELAESRARLVTVADEERRRIERDLHDGAQQRLVALRIKLELLAERIAREPLTDPEDVRRLEDDVVVALDEVRRFGRGVYPSLLGDRGLRDTLLAAARTAPLPASVEVSPERRYPPEIEAAVYFCCLEALQNAGKHAEGASRVAISVGERGGCLHFEVRDDGDGFRPEEVAAGAGLTNLEDRLRALGGTLEVDSGDGRGTSLRGTIPLDSDEVRAATRARTALAREPR